MKKIKFIMSSGPGLIIPFDKAQSILESPQQIVMLYDEKGDWTGKTINKAHIVDTDIDYSEIRASDRPPELSEPMVDPKLIKKLTSIKPEYLKKPYKDD